MKTMRIVLAICAMTAGLALVPDGAQARRAPAPWCAVSEIGPANEVWDCSYWSLKACVPYVIAGNRGACQVNPAYPGVPAELGGKVRVRRR